MGSGGFTGFGKVADIGKALDQIGHRLLRQAFLFRDLLLSPARQPQLEDAAVARVVDTDTSEGTYFSLYLIANAAWLQADHMSTCQMEDGTVVKIENATQSWNESTRWDGNNNISVATGGQWNHQTLYRSRKGRYYSEHTSQWQGSRCFKGANLNMIIIAILACSTALVAQPTPHIAAVVNAADFTSSVAYGGLGTVFGTALSDANYSATALPLPKKLGPTELFVCVGGNGYANRTEITDAGCEALQLVYASPTQINFLTFNSLPQKPGFAGQLFAFVRVNGALSDGNTTTPPAVNPRPPASRLFLVDSAPAIFPAGIDHYIDARFISPTTLQTMRRAITDRQGKVLTSANPARVGQYYTIWLTGLGIFTNGKPKTQVSMSFGAIPVYGYQGSITMPASLAYVGPSPQFPGLYQINFQLPSFVVDGKALDYGAHYSPGAHFFPCGDYAWEIAVDPQARSGWWPWWTEANAVLIPVVVKNGDVACGGI